MAQAAAQCEARGVKTALIVEDMSTDGTQEGMLLFDFRGLDALVNVGGSQETIEVPAMERAVGESGDPAFLAARRVSYGGLCGVIEQVGASRMRAVIR